MASGYSAAEQKINLSVLQQKDPYITGIADSASQVAAYSFNAALNEWEKTNIEGTLFVYARSAFPLNGFMIINRLHLNDLIEPINKNLEFQLQDPFLLYRNSQAAIYGIWFYDRDECARIGQLMNSLVQVATDAQDQEMGRQRRASESDSAKERPSASNENIKSISPQRNNVDIIQMLSKAQDEYDKSKTEPKKLKTSTSKDENQPINTTLLSSPVGSATNSSPVRRVSASPSAVKQQASFDVGITFKPSGSGDVQQLGSTHINLETLFRKASQHHEKTTSDQRFMNTSIKSAFHMPPLLPPNQTTPTVEEIERAQRENSAGGHGSSSTTTAAATTTDIKTNFVSVADSHHHNFYNHHNGNRSQAPESPNTALRRTLKIVPPVLSGTSTSSTMTVMSTTVPLEIGLPLPAKQPDLSYAFTTSKSQHSVVQALFSQQHQAGRYPCTTSVSVVSATALNSSGLAPFSLPAQNQQVPGHTLVSDWLSKSNQIPPNRYPPTTTSSVLGVRNSPLDVTQQVSKPSSTSEPSCQFKPGGEGLPPAASSELFSRQISESLAKPETFLATFMKSESLTTSTTTTNTTLLSPMAFQTPVSKSSKLTKDDEAANPGANFLASSNLNSVTNAIKNHFSSNRTSYNDLTLANYTSEVSLTPLSKEQLRQALITLLKTDNKFLSSIHEAYTASLNKELVSRNSKH